MNALHPVLSSLIELIDLIAFCLFKVGHLVIFVAVLYRLVRREVRGD